MPSYMQALQYGLIGFLPLAIVLGVSSYALATPCSVLIRQEQYSARCAVVLRQPNPVPGIRSSLCVLVLRSGMMVREVVVLRSGIFVPDCVHGVRADAHRQVAEPSPRRLAAC